MDSSFGHLQDKINSSKHFTRLISWVTCFPQIKPEIEALGRKWALGRSASVFILQREQHGRPVPTAAQLCPEGTYGHSHVPQLGPPVDMVHQAERHCPIHC